MKLFAGFLVQAVRIAVRNLPGMLAWMLAAWVANHLLFQLAVRLARTNAVLGASVFALSVIALLAGIIGMFYVLQDDLPFLAHERDETTESSGLAGIRVRERHALEALAASLLPFVVIYGAWGLLREQWGDYLYSNIMSGHLRAGTPGLMMLGAAAAAFVIRLLFERRWRRTSGVASGLIAGLFEGVWMVLALVGVRDLILHVTSWVKHRRVVDSVLSGWHTATGWVADIPIPPTPYHLSDLSGPWLGDLRSGITLALVWLALAATILGRDMEVFEQATLDARRPRRRAGILRHVPHWMFRLIESASGEIREKYVPLLVAGRMVMHAGWMVFLAFAAAYATVVTGSEWASVGVTRLLGPHEFAFWTGYDQSLELVRLAITEPIRIALLAVAVDTVLALSARRVVARHAGMPGIPGHRPTNDESETGRERGNAG